MSMMVHMLVGACLLFMGVLTNAERYTCDSQKLDGCISPLLQEYAYGQKDFAMFFVAGAHLDEEALNSFCSDIQHSTGCVNDFLKSCNDFTKTRFRSFFNMHEYVCGEGKQVYLSEQQCLSQPELTKPELADDLDSCNERAADKMQSATRELHNNMNNPSRAEADKIRMEFCSSVDVFDHCMRSSVGKYCSEEAQNFTVSVYDAGFEPMVSGFHCDDTSFSYSGLSSKMIVLYSLAAVAFLVLAVGAVVLRMYIRKRRLASYQGTYADCSRLM